LRSGKADVVANTIKVVSEKKIQLTSGAVLRPDIIIAATGIKLCFAGGTMLSVNCKILDVSSKFGGKGGILQDIPNLLFVIGYITHRGYSAQMWRSLYSYDCFDECIGREQ
jgi:cation diffusion facilitator CzcD-associated flavoprotein CzcO